MRKIITLANSILHAFIPATDLSRQALRPRVATPQMPGEPGVQAAAGTRSPSPLGSTRAAYVLYGNSI